MVIRLSNCMVAEAAPCPKNLASVSLSSAQKELHVIDVYGMGSPNVLKIVIMLEELARPYRLHNVDVMGGEGRSSSFLAMNPLGKVPVIVDADMTGEARPIFESGAILVYLAENYGVQLLPSTGLARWEILKWLFAQVAYAGPMLGQLNHFQMMAGETDSYAGRRYRDIARKVYQDFENRLKEVPWLGGDSFSIADIAMYPWAAYLERHGVAPDNFPYLLSWRGRLDTRPSVRRAVGAFTALIAESMTHSKSSTDEDYDLFFGRSEAGPPPDMERYVSLGSFTSLKLK